MKNSIMVELFAHERDFIIDLMGFYMLDELKEKLSKPKPNKDNFIKVKLDLYELETLIGDLSLEANHNKKRHVQEMAYEIAETLESAEFSLKRKMA
ncbi:MAG: hypothetical protein CMF50_04560 [Legionellales bacterium]|nr:hypothetical protein [Legionellales bacterium]|tara:strand:+ start:431 stop:718 length:288 start_codon:yes stop_codon:yes gene_type:complete